MASGSDQELWESGCLSITEVEDPISFHDPGDLISKTIWKLEGS